MIICTLGGDREIEVNDDLDDQRDSLQFNANSLQVGSKVFCP